MPHGNVSAEENRKIVAWLAAGGVSTGPLRRQRQLLPPRPRPNTALSSTCSRRSRRTMPGSSRRSVPISARRWIRSRSSATHRFPTAMALPMAGPTKPAGVATGLRRLADAYGRPVVAYVRAENYIAPRDAAALIADGVVCSLKYAVERKDPAEDRYLAAMVDACGTERLVSGIGERPAIVHWTKFGVHAFTSGSVTIAPHLSSAIHAALARRRRRHGRGAPRIVPAVRGSARRPFADRRRCTMASRLPASPTTGPISPYLANLDDGRCAGRRGGGEGALRGERNVPAPVTPPDRSEESQSQRRSRSWPTCRPTSATTR